MVTRLSNYDVLEGWLSYLQEKVDRLVGASKDDILKAMRGYGLLQREQFYCLECPLQGKPSINLSLRYQTKDFLGSRDFTGNTGFLYARFFHLYGQIVGPEKFFSLEFDNIKGVGMVAAVFLDVRDANAEQIISKTLAFQAESRRMTRIMELLRLGRKYELEPANFGFLYSRLNGPFRLTFSIPLEVLLLPDRYDAFAYFVQELELSKQSETIQRAYEKNPEQLRQLLQNTPLMQDLITLSSFDFLDCLLDIDILPDGTIGDTIGLEILPCISDIEKQYAMLNSKEFAEFLFFLQRINVVDERIVCFADCIFYGKLQQALGPQELLVSMLSHFKLRYKKGKRLPAKVFLQGSRSFEK